MLILIEQPAASAVCHLIPCIHSCHHVIADMAVVEPDARRIRNHISGDHLRRGESENVRALAGNQNAPNLRRRVEGIKAEAAKSKGIQIVGTFYHNETPQDAAAEVIRVNNAYPGIKGWAMAGGWALYTKTLLTDLDPAKIRSCSMPMPLK